MSFAEIFKNNRKRINLTQEEIANRLSVTPQAVSKWETSMGTPDISLLVPISRLFGITTDELLGNVPKNEETILEELNETRVMEINYRNKYDKYIEMLKLYPNSRDIMQHLIGLTATWISKEKDNLTAEEKNALI